MSVPATSSQSTGAFTSFADMVDYPSLFADLQKQGITLTPEEQKKCEDICGERLRNHDGGQVIGNSFGATIQSLVYTLFAFIQNIFGSYSGVSNLPSTTGAAMTATGEQSKLWQLQLAESETYLRLKDAGGNLAAAAEYITGMKPSADHSAGKLIDASILNQVGKHINLPVDTDTSLNDKIGLGSDPTPSSGLPPKLSTQALTTRG